MRKTGYTVRIRALRPLAVGDSGEIARADEHTLKLSIIGPTVDTSTVPHGDNPVLISRRRRRKHTREMRNRRPTEVSARTQLHSCGLLALFYWVLLLRWARAAPFDPANYEDWA